MLLDEGQALLVKLAGDAGDGRGLLLHGVEIAHEIPHAHGHHGHGRQRADDLEQHAGIDARSGGVFLLGKVGKHVLAALLRGVAAFGGGVFLRAVDLAPPAALAALGGFQALDVFGHIAADAGAAVRGDGAGAQLGKVEIIDAAAFALVKHLAHQRVFLHGARLLGVFLFFAVHGAADVAADLLRHGRALVYGAIGRAGVVVGVGLHLLVFAGISGAGIGQRVLRSVRFRGDARLRGCIGNAFKAARADDLPAGADLDARLQRFSTFGAKHWVPSLPPHISMAYLLYLT